ncbi:TPA: hypothetical protein ACH3X1_005993, partial [Trebouxia sp. C0004]
KGCGKPLKSADTRLNHEKICKGVQATREELQIEKTALQAQLTNQVETSNQHMAVASSASVSAVKAVCDIMSKPHKEFDASKLAVHQPVGKETTKHCKGSSLSQHFLNLTPGIDKLEIEQIQQDVKQLLHRLAVLGRANITIFMQNLGADA